MSWIVGNSTGDRWRKWGVAGPDWVDRKEDATRYARREDAEAVHAGDEDAWCLTEYPAEVQAEEEHPGEEVARQSMERAHGVIGS